MRVLLDMDGVLVDFLSGWLKLTGRTAPDPWPAGEQELSKVFPDLQPHHVMTGCDEKFWTELPMMPDAMSLIAALVSMFRREDIVLVTSIIGTPASAAGKIHWIFRNLPMFSGQYMITPCRNNLADGDTLLIDDQTSHVWSFLKAGGKAIIVPRPWNSEHRNAHMSTKTVLAEVALFMSRAQT